MQNREENKRDKNIEENCGVEEGRKLIEEFEAQASVCLTKFVFTAVSFVMLSHEI